MAAYKVINLDSPIESDYWVDIPVRDPATNKDAVDKEGRILVKRHVTRSIKNKELTIFTNAVETVNTLKEDYSTFKGNVSTKINKYDSSILTNTNNITTLTDSVNNHDLQLHALYSKINAIKGIDIDDFKYVTETDIKNIKKDYLPLAGGTLTGAVTINNNLTVTGTVTSTFNGNLTGDVTGNITGSAKSATNDSSNRNIVNTYALKDNYPDRIKFGWDTTHKNYVNVTVDVTTWGLITTANIAQQAVNYANICNKADHATTADTANRAYPRNADGGDINFHWDGRGGQPTWLWGGTDGINMYVYNPAAFSVNYATYASRSANNGSFFISGYEISIG